MMGPPEGSESFTIGLATYTRRIDVSIGKVFYYSIIVFVHLIF